MNCRQIITHIVREGDSFYSIAQRYQIPMEIIIQQNPGMDPQNLQLGTTLVICMDENPGSQDWWENLNWNHMIRLNNAMRMGWTQHAYWTRMLLISIAQRLQDQMAVMNRLFQNPADIASVFGEFYPKEVTDTLAGLLTEHLQIAMSLITALREGSTAEAAMLTRQWYGNADRIASVLSSINPYYQMEEVRQLLYRHLSQIQREVAARLAGDYEADIQAFDEVEKGALQIADYLTSGLVMQFPQRFREM